MTTPTLSELLSREQLDNAALCGKIKFYRDVMQQIGKAAGYNGNQETVLDAVKRVVRERNGLTADNDKLNAHLLQLKEEQEQPL